MLEVRDTAFKHYFGFIAERMNIFWNRVEGKNKLTDDSILKEHKFTNVYRVLDRVSQYLISEVIYNPTESSEEEDIFTRIIVFKIFNKIETWEYIKINYGEVTYSNFDPERLSRILTELQIRTPIFSAAYMMTGSHSRYNHLKTKHHKWLYMVQEELINGRLFLDILKSKSLEEVYVLLRNCSFMGDFIAYQYATDLNYSNCIDYDENSFVMAGIGAVRGIKKCFKNLGGLSTEGVIRHVYDNFEFYAEKYDCTSIKLLSGRDLKLIDLQNCFCETDKYLRAKMPELSVGNKRIKQRYKSVNKPISYRFPPKWGVNEIKSSSWNLSHQELTLF
ncbi:putative DNA base hypermodification protein [Neolewinella lacunae]|uniref:5-hmdU DNA kinase helical domain-containing protein n=1 Tax=Neolewinella lacunae TaxID=1517758 RepID=A0A923T8Q1_9BACT|nr:nucleotide kinase domain-containing protein [Neolewinella lacunae]MBC6995875.1 hypothetical protein [Neolewinella lacunae]MDN3636432.1 putative DNA base hypermodification protein [Neolewinella lacunae]